MAVSAPRHRYPFVPGLFYYLPVQWLQEVMTTGDLDTRDLLMALADDASGVVAFSDDGHETDWTRSEADGAPGFVSHPTYHRSVNALIAAGHLEQIARRPAAYRLTTWPGFAGLGLIYKPRAYVLQRWTHWFGKNAWGPRAALVAFFAKMVREQEQQFPVTPPTQLDVTAYKNELRALVRELLPKAACDNKVGDGLMALTRLGLLQEVSRSRNNARYFMRADALNRRPDLPLHEIASLCQLDDDAEREWGALIQTCLRLTYRPVGDAPEIWRLLRTYDPDIATPEDARAVRAHLERMAVYTEPRLKRALGDFVRARRRENRANWAYGKEFALSVQSVAEARDVTMPHLTSRSLQATQLLVRYQRQRISLEDARQAAAVTELTIRQDEMWLPLVGALKPDRCALQDHSRVGCNHLHGRLDYARPFSVILRCAAPAPGLGLLGRFRVLQPAS
jgi:hypothetical protein